MFQKELRTAISGFEPDSHMMGKAKKCNFAITASEV